jgi:hypothetical protein
VKSARAFPIILTVVAKFETIKRSELRESDKQKILERDCFICAYCDGIADFVDHVVPFAYSFCNDEFNLVASCEDCNRIASDKIFPSFSEKRMFIRNVRKGKKWSRRLFRKYSICIDCGKLYYPGNRLATHFLCPDCTKIEYGTPGYFEIKYVAQDRS